MNSSTQRLNYETERTLAVKQVEWHSLVPITYADTPDLARWVPWCGVCNPAEAI